MIIDAGTRRIALVDDQVAAVYLASSVHTAALKRTRVSAQGRRVVVELQRQISGHPQRALVGASLRPSAGHALKIEVPTSGTLTRGAAAECPSFLDEPLVAGLPSEFAPSVVEGLAEVDALGSGLLRIDRAAYDELASSPWAFRHAAEILALALTEDHERMTDVVRERMANWG